MKKKLSPHHIAEYIPARLVEGKTRWHIVYSYTNGYSNETIRLKLTYNLNRIKKVRLRRKTGNDIVSQLNKLLPLGYPWKQIERDNAVLSVTDLREAVAFAVNMKTIDLRERTKGSYESMSTILIDFTEEKYKKMNVGAFTTRHAQAFLDYLTIQRRTRAGKRLTNKTYNAYLNLLKGVWDILIKREYIVRNPWADYKEKKVKEKIARDYSHDELRVIIRRVGQEDKYLLLAMTLLYYCFIRPTELTRLRVRNLRIRDSRIVLEGLITKNGKNRSPTIPDLTRKFIESFKFESFGSNAYVFGRKAKRSKVINTCADFPVSYKVFNNRLKRIIEKLNEEGSLSDIHGMVFYGLKDTGATDLIEQGVNAYELMRQIGHSSLSETQTYLMKKKKVIQAVKEHKTDILAFTDLPSQEQHQ